MSDEASRIAAGAQAEVALDRYLRPAFAVVRAEYIEKLADIAGKPLGPHERAGIEKLALAVKVGDQVRVQIEQIVLDGRLAANEHNRADRIMQLSPERRKMMGITL